MKRRHGYLEPGDIVTIAHRKYVAILNTPQILTKETNCVGCAFCKVDGGCDHAAINKFKNFHCGNVEDDIENQVLLKLQEVVENETRNDH